MDSVKLMQLTKNGLLVFTKTPDSGKVKTRLHPTLDHNQAAKLATTLLQHTLAITTHLKNINIELHILGNFQHACFQPYLDHPNISLHQQQGDDLGVRLSGAVKTAFLRYERIVIIGSDCAVITPEYIEAAFSYLQQTDVVIGPALDGGYILLGLNQPSLAIFKNIPWSTSSVLTVTRERLVTENLRWMELPTLWDIDYPDDLIKFHRWYLANANKIALLSYPHFLHEIFESLSKGGLRKKTSNLSCPTTN